MFIEELKEFFDKEKLYEKFEKKILNAEWIRKSPNDFKRAILYWKNFDS